MILGNYVSRVSHDQFCLEMITGELRDCLPAKLLIKFYRIWISYFDVGIKFFVKIFKKYQIFKKFQLIPLETLQLCETKNFRDYFFASILNSWQGFKKLNWHAYKKIKQKISNIIGFGFKQKNYMKLLVEYVLVNNFTE